MRTTILAASFVLLCASTTFAQHAEEGGDLVLDLAQPHSPVPTDESNDDRAIASYTEAIRLDPKNACVYYYKRGIAWHNKGECDNAIADLTEAIRLDAQCGLLCGVRDGISNTKGDVEMASADLMEDPQDASSFRLRALRWWKKKDFDKAIADFSNAIRIDPQDAFSFRARSWCWSGKEEYDKAIDDLTEAITIDPKNASSFSFRAQCWSGKEEYDKAIDDLTEAIAIDPKNANSFSFRAQCWVQKKEFDKAIEDNTEALKIDPRSTFAFLSRAQCWLQKKDFDRAIADYSGVIECDPKHAVSFYCRGLCWRDKGTFDEALYDCLQASIIDPKNANYVNEIAWLYATCPVEKYRHGQKAIEFATKACELNSWKDAGNIDTLAAAYAEAGNFEKAVEWQTKAIELAEEGKQNDFKARLERFKSAKPYRGEPNK